MIQDTDAVLATLEVLRQRGVRISLDDFGTGFSSLSYLASFPFDKIKIDRSFVKSLAHNPKSMIIVRHIVDMAGQFGMVTTAEGIETTEQFDSLRDIGCQQAQGYLFSRPLPAWDIAAWHSQRKEPRKVA
jgi:EAL domain-containing protein (putative c-di-GMP-specific phosphodiesterase class I)